MRHSCPVLCLGRFSAVVCVEGAGVESILVCLTCDVTWKGWLVSWKAETVFRII